MNKGRNPLKSIRKAFQKGKKSSEASNDTAKAGEDAADHAGNEAISIASKSGSDISGSSSDGEDSIDHNAIDVQETIEEAGESQTSFPEVESLRDDADDDIPKMDAELDGKESAGSEKYDDLDIAPDSPREGDHEKKADDESKNRKDKREKKPKKDKKSKKSDSSKKANSPKKKNKKSKNIDESFVEGLHDSIVSLDPDASAPDDSKRKSRSIEPDDEKSRSKSSKSKSKNDEPEGSKRAIRTALDESSKHSRKKESKK